MEYSDLNSVHLTTDWDKARIHGPLDYGPLDYGPLESRYGHTDTATQAWRSINPWDKEYQCYTMEMIWLTSLVNMQLICFLTALKK